MKLSILGFNKTSAGEIWNVKCAIKGSEIYNLNWRSEYNSQKIQKARTNVYVKMVPSKKKGFNIIQDYFFKRESFNELKSLAIAQQLTD